MRSSWIIHVGMCPHKFETEGGRHAQRRRQYEDGSGEWSDVATSQGSQQPPEEAKKEPSQSLRREQPSCPLDFRLPASKTEREYISVVLVTRFVVMWCGSDKNGI